MLKAVLIIFLSVLLVSCAGPTDPFGSISNFEYSEVNADGSDLEGDASISFYPERVISHQSQNFKITIFDPQGIGRNHDFKVRYNDHYIEAKWLQKAKKQLSEDGKTLVIDFGRLRFLPNRDNFIVASYQRDEKSEMTAKQYLNPVCNIDDYQIVKNFGRFKNKKEIINKIESIARMHNINPSFITALIAQESSFDAGAVSWAKAVGLTQVTTIASEQIAKETKEWPRHRGIASMSVPTLKWFISNNEINEQNEWRLNEELSIKGGIQFLSYLDYYWSKKENVELLNTAFDKKVPRSNILLASYNSGAFNVKKAINRNGSDWLKARHLSEARKYVGKINSFCYAFTKK